MERAGLGNTAIAQNFSSNERKFIEDETRTNTRSTVVTNDTEMAGRDPDESPPARARKR